MDEDSPAGCYGTKCRDCEYVNAKRGSDEQIKCHALCLLAIDKLTREEPDDIGEWDEGWD